MTKQVQTQVGSEITFKGITYKSCRNEQNDCNGCDIFEGKSKDYSMCEEVSCDHVIWIKKEKPMNTTEQTTETVEVPPEEPKYTVEEFSEAFANCAGVHIGDWDILQIKKYLDKQNSPEYQLYLKLKKQFGE